MTKFNNGDVARITFGDRVLVKVVGYDAAADWHTIQYLEPSYLEDGELFRSTGDKGKCAPGGLELVKANEINISHVTKYRVYYDGGDWEFAADKYERAYGFAVAAYELGKFERFVAEEVVEREIEL